eukprot:4171572-Pyramimonas_sp.AAC.1
MTSFYGSSCADNGEGALDTPERKRAETIRERISDDVSRDRSRTAGLSTLIFGWHCFYCFRRTTVYLPSGKASARHFDSTRT